MSFTPTPERVEAAEEGLDSPHGADADIAVEVEVEVEAELEVERIISSPGLLRRWAQRGALVAAGLAVTVTVLATAGPRLVPFYRTLSVRSGSMEPTLPVGALVVLRPVAAEDLRVGDIITFHRPGVRPVLVTHRIVGIEDDPGGRVFVTKGDANGAVDGWVVPARGRGWRYAFAVPYLGYVFGAPPSSGRLALLVGTVGLLCAWALMAIWRTAPPPTGAPAA